MALATSSGSISISPASGAPAGLAGAPAGGVPAGVARNDDLSPVGDCLTARPVAKIPAATATHDPLSTAAKITFRNARRLVMAAPFLLAFFRYRSAIAGEGAS